MKLTELHDNSISITLLTKGRRKKRLLTTRPLVSKLFELLYRWPTVKRKTDYSSADEIYKIIVYNHSEWGEYKGNNIADLNGVSLRVSPHQHELYFSPDFTNYSNGFITYNY